MTPTEKDDNRIAICETIDFQLNANESFEDTFEVLLPKIIEALAGYDLIELHQDKIIGID